MEALKWPSLRSRGDEHIHKLVRKCIDCWCPQYFKNYFFEQGHLCLFNPPEQSFALPSILSIRTEVAWRFFYMYYHESMVFNNIIKFLGDLSISSSVKLPLYIYFITLTPVCFL